MEAEFSPGERLTQTGLTLPGHLLAHRTNRLERANRGPFPNAAPTKLNLTVSQQLEVGFSRI